jgi:gluconokinase
MGVSGSGKTTVARALATALGEDMIEADDLHDQNVERMRHRIPLDDAAGPRGSSRARRDRVAGQGGSPRGRGVLALKAAYRETCSRAADALIVYLRVDRECRAAAPGPARPLHPASLLDSQLRTRAPPDALVVDDDADPDAVIAEILAALDRRS